MKDAIKVLDPIRDLRLSPAPIQQSTMTAVLDLNSTRIGVGKPNWFRTTYATKKPNDPNNAVYIMCQVQIDNILCTAYCIALSSWFGSSVG